LLFMLLANRGSIDWNEFIYHGAMSGNKRIDN
jgi:hypothetical protein